MTLFFAKFSENFFALPYRSNPCVDQGVDHSGHCLSNLKGVFSGKIDFSGMRVFVSGNPTSFANPLEGRRYSDCLNFLVKLVGLFEALHVFVLTVSIHNSFKTDPQKGTCCTRGKSDDGLSFVKNFFGIFGHIFRRDYSVANGVLNLSVFPENQVSTTAALSNENSFGMKEVKQAIVSSVFQSITLTLIKIIQRRCFPSFRVRANNQFKNKHRQSSAVRAFIGLRHD